MRISMLTALLLLTAAAPVAGAGPAGDDHASIAHPTGATSVVLRVTTGGGFVTQQTSLRTMPSFTLYGDGTVITPGAIRMIYPGPAILPLVRSRLSERQVQAVLRRARQAGLLAPGAIAYGMPGVSDMATTTLVLNAAGRSVRRSAYALGMTAPGGRVTAKQARARRVLASFIARLPHGAAGARYTPHAIALYVQPASGPAQPGAHRIAWPLESNLATAGKHGASGLSYRCITVRGRDVETLLATLGRANELSRWVPRAGSSARFSIVARPLLPDERHCP
jgi:hypothetical protein